MRYQHTPGQLSYESRTPGGLTIHSNKKNIFMNHHVSDGYKLKFTEVRQPEYPPHEEEEPDAPADHGYQFYLHPPEHMEGGRPLPHCNCDKCLPPKVHQVPKRPDSTKIQLKPQLTLPKREQKSEEKSLKATVQIKISEPRTVQKPKRSAGKENLETPQRRPPAPSDTTPSVQVSETPARSSGRSVAPCRCKRSLCLKLYCECLRNGRTCGKECQCSGCKNCEGN